MPVTFMPVLPAPPTNWHEKRNPHAALEAAPYTKGQVVWSHKPTLLGGRVRCVVRIQQVQVVAVQQSRTQPPHYSIKYLVQPRTKFDTWSKRSHWVMVETLEEGYKP